MGSGNFSAASHTIAAIELLVRKERVNNARNGKRNFAQSLNETNWCSDRLFEHEAMVGDMNSQLE